MKALLRHHKLRLIQAKQFKIIEDNFESGLGKWRVVSGDFHQVTVDTNEDDKTGMEGELLINACGSYYGGVIEREIELSEYGEIVFERYVKNDSKGKSKNKLRFYIDGTLKLEIEGPNPWRRIEPIGVAPGKHVVRFEYEIQGSPISCSGVFDSFSVWEGRDLNGTVSTYKPPKPSGGITSTQTLRGFTRYQQMAERDTEINFSMMFGGPAFIDFLANINSPFYFIDEFGICYRGIFPEEISPESPALNTLYVVSLRMIAPQKVGVGFA